MLLSNWKKSNVHTLKPANQNHTENLYPIRTRLVTHLTRHAIPPQVAPRKIDVAVAVAVAREKIQQCPTINLTLEKDQSLAKAI